MRSSGVRHCAHPYGRTRQRSQPGARVASALSRMSAGVWQPGSISGRRGHRRRRASRSGWSGVFGSIADSRATAASRSAGAGWVSRSLMPSNASLAEVRSRTPGRSWSGGCEIGLLGSLFVPRRVGVSVIAASCSSGMAIDGRSGSVRLIRSARASRRSPFRSESTDWSA
jgi:hypothetical protein